MGPSPPRAEYPPILSATGDAYGVHLPPLTDVEQTFTWYTPPDIQTIKVYADASAIFSGAIEEGRVCGRYIRRYVIPAGCQDYHCIGGDLLGAFRVVDSAPDTSISLTMGSTRITDTIADLEQAFERTPIVRLAALPSTIHLRVRSTREVTMEHSVIIMIDHHDRQEMADSMFNVNHEGMFSLEYRGYPVMKGSAPSGG